ncbi:MAG: ATP-binding protein [bacterium]|nr:ATP-binding protein [bacterium]MDY4098744.1 ATP-binding protein [Lachnospiraceae bacterium]
MHELKLMASDETLYTVIGEIEQLLDENHCPETLKMIMLVAVEEIFVNIAHYAYGGNPGEAVIDLDVIPNPKSCRVVFRDKGVPYNPLEKADPDITLSAEERNIGGLGIYMVKQSMDKVEYRYEDGYNILTIEKNIDDSALEE